MCIVSVKVSVIIKAGTMSHAWLMSSIAALVKTEAKDGEDSLTLLYKVEPGVCDQVNQNVH